MNFVEQLIEKVSNTFYLECEEPSEHVKAIVKLCVAETAKKILLAVEHNVMTGMSTEGEMKMECRNLITQAEGVTSATKDNTPGG